MVYFPAPEYESNNGLSRHTKVSYKHDCLSRDRSISQYIMYPKNGIGSSEYMFVIDRCTQFVFPS